MLRDVHGHRDRRARKGSSSIRIPTRAVNLTVATSDSIGANNAQGCPDSTPATDDDEQDFCNPQTIVGSIAWEKRSNANGLLQGGATFTVGGASGPFACYDGTTNPVAVPDNGVNDFDPTAGEILFENVCPGTYTVTETVPPASFSLDPDNIRSVTVAATGTAEVIGTQGSPQECSTSSPFGDSSAADSDEADFCNPQNTPPVAVDDTYTTNEDTNLVLDAVAIGPNSSPVDNDTDANGDTLTVTAVTGASGGTVNLASGTITFSPAPNLCGAGAGAFDYTVSDGKGGTDTGHVTVNITCVDDPGTAVNDAATVVEDSSSNTINVLVNDTDPDGGSTVQSVTQPTNGTVVNNGANVSYTPNPNYCNGGSPTDNFTYTLNGGSTATVAVTVTCVNDPPVIAFTTGDTSAIEGQTKTYTFSITDPDSTTFTWENGYPSCGSSGTVFGTPTVGATSGSFQCAFPDDAPTGTSSDTTTVRAKVRDATDASNEITRDVTVNNVAPSVVVTGPSPVDEAQTLRNYVFDTTDPGVPDTFTHGPASCGASGVLVGPVVFNAATGDGNFDCRFADDNPTGTASDTSTVSITVSDDDTGSDAGSKDVTVNNVAPSVVVTGPSPVDEAQTLRNYVFDTTDPGVPDTFTHGPASCGASGVLRGPGRLQRGHRRRQLRLPLRRRQSDRHRLRHVHGHDHRLRRRHRLGRGFQGRHRQQRGAERVVTGPSPVDEAQTLRNYVFDTTDPGVPDTFTPRAGLAAGPRACCVGPVVFNAATGDGNFDCRFADDNPTGTASDTSTVTMTVTDDDTGSDAGIQVTSPSTTWRRASSSPGRARSTRRRRCAPTSSTPPTRACPTPSPTAGTRAAATGVLVGPVSFNAATGDGSFDCRFADDNPTGTALRHRPRSAMTVTDDDTGSGPRQPRRHRQQPRSRPSSSPATRPVDEGRRSHLQLRPPPTRA